MLARIWRYIEGPVLLFVPPGMGIMLYLGIAQAALLMLAMVALVLALFFAGYEASRPASDYANAGSGGVGRGGAYLVWPHSRL